MKDSTVAVWDLRACRMAWSVKAHDNECRSVEYSADGRFLISGSFDSTVSIIDMDVWERRVVARYAEHKHKVLRATWHGESGGSMFATASADRTVKIWAV